MSFWRSQLAKEGQAARGIFGFGLKLAGGVYIIVWGLISLSLLATPAWPIGIVSLLLWGYLLIRRMRRRKQQS